MPLSDTSRARLKTAVKVIILVVALGSLGWVFFGQWQEARATLRDAARDLNINWSWIAVASVIVLATHAALVRSWQILLAGWGGHLRFGEAVQIWTIANLGKWIPGKVWQVGVMGMMAAEAGVSGVAAAGAALLGTLLNIGAGFGIAAITGAQGLDTLRPGLRTVAWALAFVFVLGVLALPAVLPTMLNAFARWRGLPATGQHLSHRTIWLATAINTASWVAYGVAFACFSRGVTPSISGNPSVFVAVYTASYLVGYLVLFAPGGLGFREFALVALLVGLGAANKGDAAILSVTSRVWITVLEVLPGLVSLAMLTPVQRAALRRRG